MSVRKLHQEGPRTSIIHSAVELSSCSCCLDRVLVVVGVERYRERLDGDGDKGGVRGTFELM